MIALQDIHPGVGEEREVDQLSSTRRLYFASLDSDDAVLGVWSEVRDDADAKVLQSEGMQILRGPLPFGEGSAFVTTGDDVVPSGSFSPPDSNPFSPQVVEPNPGLLGLEQQFQSVYRNLRVAGTVSSHATKIQVARGELSNLTIDESAVLALLRPDAKAIAILSEVIDNLPVYFPEYDGLRVSVLLDPDDDGAGDLYFLVQTKLSSEDALARLRTFDSEWWLQRQAGIEKPPIVSLEFM